MKRLRSVPLTILVLAPLSGCFALDELFMSREQRQERKRLREEWEMQRPKGLSGYEKAGIGLMVAGGVTLAVMCSRPPMDDFEDLAEMMLLTSAGALGFGAGVRLLTESDGWEFKDWLRSRERVSIGPTGFQMVYRF